MAEVKFWAKSKYDLMIRTCANIPQDNLSVNLIGTDSVMGYGDKAAVVAFVTALASSLDSMFYTTEFYFNRNENAIYADRFIKEIEMQEELEFIALQIEDERIGYFPKDIDHEKVWARQIYTFPLPVLERSLINLLDARREENKGISGFNPTRLDWDSSIVKIYLELVDKIKASAKKGNFTDVFENVNLLNAFIASKSKEFNFFVGDWTLGLILSTIALKLSSFMYETLEQLEANNKQLFVTRYKALEL